MLLTLMTYVIFCDTLKQNHKDMNLVMINWIISVGTNVN
jgi:hypothetical protein